MRLGAPRDAAAARHAGGSWGERVARFSGGRPFFAVLVPLALLAALVIGAVANGRQPLRGPGVGPQVGLLAPPLLAGRREEGRRLLVPLEDQWGRPVRLEDCRGRVVFLNFWASWCKPCRDEMPDLQRFERGKGGAVPVLLVNSTVQDDERGARLFLEQGGFGLRSAFDRTGEVTGAYGVYFFPTTFVLDAGGVIRARIEGRMSPAMMEAALRKALGAAGG